MNKYFVGICFSVAAAFTSAHAEQIGSVDTVFKILGPDHKIVVEAFDDPDIKTSRAISAERKLEELKVV